MKLEYTCEHFQRDLYKLWKADKYCDVILIGGDGKTKISAHRIVLAASTPYFAHQSFDADGNIKKEIVVAGIDGATLKLLVDVCYSGKLEVDETNVSSVYMGAAHLQLNSLLVTMDNYIMEHLTIANCLHFREVAEMCNRSVLFEATGHFICKHFTEITDHSSFLKLDAKRLKSLLALEGLIVNSAENLFQNVVKWIQHGPYEQRNDVLPELFPHLRLRSMTPKFLIQHVRPRCKTFEVIKLMMEAMEKDYSGPPVRKYQTWTSDM